LFTEIGGQAFCKDLLRLEHNRKFRAYLERSQRLIYISGVTARRDRDGVMVKRMNLEGEVK
jgi:hypothetical protein